MIKHNIGDKKSLALCKLHNIKFMSHLVVSEVSINNVWLGRHCVLLKSASVKNEFVFATSLQHLSNSLYLIITNTHVGIIKSRTWFPYVFYYFLFALRLF